MNEDNQTSIDENISGFAPSQNPRDPIDISKVQTQNDSTSFVNRINKRMKDELDQSLALAVKQNADKFAEEQRLGAITGYGQMIAATNISQARSDAMMIELRKYDLQNRSPYLASQMRDPNFAAQSYDDVPNLVQNEYFLDSLESLGNNLGAIPERWSGGKILRKQGVMYFNAMVSEWEDESVEKGFLSYGDKLGKDYEASSSGGGSFIGGSSEVLGQMYAGIPTIATTSLAGAGIGAGIGLAGFGVGAAPGAVGGAAIGITAGIAADAFIVESGHMYGDMRKKGFDRETATAGAITTGAFNAVIEALGSKIVLAPYKKLISRTIASTISREMTKVVFKKTNAMLVKAAVYNYLKVIAVETGQEVSQESVNIIVEKLLRVMSSEEINKKLETEAGWNEIVERIGDIAFKTAASMTLLAGVGSGIHVANERSQGEVAQKRADIIASLIKNGEESKLAKRSPDDREKFMAAQLQGKKSEVLYINAQELMSLLQSMEIREGANREGHGILDSDLESVLPGVLQQLAVPGVVDVSIPTHVFLERTSRTELGKALLDHIRVGVGALSVADARRNIQKMNDDMESTKDLIAQQDKIIDGFEKSARQVFDTVEKSLLAAGRSKTEAAMGAMLVQAMVVTGAARNKITPEQWLAANPLPIIRSPQEQQSPAQQVAPTINELEKFLTVEDRQELSDLEKQKTEDDGGTLSDRSKLAIQDRKSDLIQQRELEQDRPEVMKSLLEENAGKESDTASMVRRFLNATAGGAVSNIAFAFDKGLISDLELAVIIKRLEAITDKESSAEFRNWSRSHKNKEIGKAFGELPIADEMNEHPKTASQFIAKLIPKTIAQYKLDKEARAKAREAQQAPAQGSFEQASRADLGLGEQAAPAPDSGVFDANNPPVSSKAIFALMDADGKIYYDINATMHGDFVETFPEIVDTTIDGGFIVNGKYMMGKSDGGYSALEGTDEQIDAVRNFTEQANTQGFQESKYRPAVVAWAKERFGNRTAPDGSTVWQNFTEWFGDSKVVDAEGKPMVVYHGTQNEKMNEFSKTRPAYFTADKQLADEFADRSYWGEALIEGEVPTTISAYLSIKNPLVITTEKEYESEMMDKASVGHLLDRGYDGIIYNPDDRGSSYFLTVSPTQIKSSIANTGEFSATDPNILRQSAVGNSGPIESAKAAVAKVGREAIAESDVFFANVWKDLLKETRRQLKLHPSNFREAARRAISDIRKFLAENPKFADYYENDWKLTREILSDFYGRPITDDEFVLFRMFAGLSSPNTKLPSNMSDAVGFLDWWIKHGNFDAIKLGPSSKSPAIVLVPPLPFSISGTTGNIKARSIKALEQLVNRFGSATAAVAFLQESVTVKELHKFNREMGYKGDVTNIGNIKTLVKEATGQDTIIPRMFIFGQKVGAYTLNAIGDSRYTTIDIWESRFIRSYFDGMFEVNTGLPVGVAEHEVFTRFNAVFAEEFESDTGQKWAASALQAIRWFYIIDAASKSGYRGASTNETISEYTRRKLEKTYGYAGHHPQGGATGVESGRPGTQEWKDQVAIAREWRPVAVPAGLSASESARAISGQAVDDARRVRKGVGRAAWSYDSRRDTDSGRKRVLKNLGVTYKLEWSAGQALSVVLKKANVSDLKFYELGQTLPNGEAFRKLVDAAKKSQKHGAAVFVYPAKDYESMRTFVSGDGLTGFAIKPDGDIVSVFSHPTAKGGQAAMEAAVAVGGKKLDAFDTILPDFYAPHGFRVVSRLAWDESQAPKGWDKAVFAKFNNGEPDVVFMALDEQYFGAYSTTDGIVGKDYNDAVAIQKAVVAMQPAASGPLEQSQAAEGKARGSYDPIKNLMALGANADSSTFPHELMHWRLIKEFEMASNPNATAEQKADADILLKWFGIAGENVDERLANWNAMTLEQQRPHHEAFALNGEIFLYTGKAPSVELQGVFEKYRRWLIRVYISIRDDLNAIYKNQFGTDLPFLTEEIRGVFDRMLASEEQISRREAIDNFKAQYQTQEESGMNDATWAAYQAMIAEAHEMAVTDLTAASVKQMQWLSGARGKILKDMQTAHNAVRRAAQTDEAEKMNNEPVRRAERFLRTGKMLDAEGKEVEFLVGNKLDRSTVINMYPTSTASLTPAVDLTNLQGMMTKDGLAPDLAAEMFGFSSGDQLVRALAELKPYKEELKERTDARMMDEHGELNTPEAREEAVQKALANEARSRFVAVENRFLSKAKTPVAVILQGAKELARTILGRMAIKDIKPRNYSLTEARVAKEKSTAVQAMQSAETASKRAYKRSYNEQIAAGVEETVAVAEALKKGTEAATRAQAKIDAHKKQYGDVSPEVVAIKASHQQVIQNQLAKEAHAIKDEIKTQVERFKRFFKLDKNIAKTRNMDLVNAARSILAFYGLGKHDKLPSAYLEQLKEYNPGLFETISAMVNKAQVGTPNYQLLTIDEFRSMQETVDALWELAKRENQIKIEGEMVSLGQAIEKLEERLDVIGVPTTIAGENQAVTFKDRVVRHINSAKALLRRIEHWADSTDGANNVGGPFTKYIWRPISQALDAYRIDRNKYVKRYVELLRQVPLVVGKIAAPELNYTFGAGNGGIGIAELLGAIMHSGNISNLEKLLLGRGWATVSEDGTMDTSRWNAFIERVTNDGTLTKEHFDFVQAVWDLNEELKPMAQKAHHDIEGYYFKEVEATPFTNRFGTYRGGYVPAKTDPFIVRDAQRQAKMSELESDFRYAMPSTGTGFMKSRVKYTKALSLDIRLMAKHIDDVIRYSHVQPAVKDVLRILKNRSFADKLTRMDPMAIDEMLMPWLNRAARQISTEHGKMKAFDAFWKTVRSRAGVSLMVGNLVNAFQQVTGLFMSALKVNPTHLGNTLYAYITNPHKSAQEVAALSQFMSNSMENQIFDLQDQMNQLILNPNKFQRFKAWSSHHGYFLQKAFQNMVNIVTWIATYNQHLEESGVGMSDAAAQREAVNKADAAVRLTQGTMNPESIAAFEVGTPFYKTFVQFTGYFNMLANLNTDEYVKIFRDLGWRGNKGKLAYTFLMGYAAQAIISDAIVKTMLGKWDDDDDDGYLDVFMDWIFGSLGRSAIAMVPFGSSAYTALTTAYNNNPFDDRITSSPSISALESSTFGSGKAIINIFSEDKEVTGKNVKDIMTLISVTTGIPVNVLGRPASYLVDVERGEVEPTSTTDYVRGLITGAVSKESKKR